MVGYNYNFGYSLNQENSSLSRRDDLEKLGLSIMYLLQEFPFEFNDEKDFLIKKKDYL